MVLPTPSHKWSPIEDLPQDWQTTLVNPQVSALVQVWHEQAGELREKELYKNFLQKLRRQWAIETGVIEQFYSLSEGATKTLIEHGLDAALISHEESDESPESVVTKIKDQYQAIEGLYQFVSSARPLGKSYIKELHQVLTAHQPTYRARDTLGNEVERELPRGEWKKLPNNIEGPGGYRFEFCPPEHVEREMERLLELYDAHQKMSPNNVPPNVEAAWLHHRFALIHPFTDGNGRVARCLATLVLLKANWLPLVVTRHDRASYIDALRNADLGDLSPLVALIDSLQRKAIREALSLSEDVIHEASAIRTVLDSVKGRLAERRAKFTEQIASEGVGFKAYARGAQRNSAEANYHYFQIIQCARALGYYANLALFQAWALLAIDTETHTEILFSLHGIGHTSTGVLGCSAMVYNKETTDDGQRMIGDVRPLGDAPFEFTYADDPLDVEKRFRKWLDERVMEGLDHWQKGI
jgi:Fic family protein